MYCALWRWEKQATSCHAAQASDFHLQLFAPVMWTQLVSQGQDPYTMFMLHPLIKPLQREVFDCRRKKMVVWLVCSEVHSQTGNFDWWLWWSSSRNREKRTHFYRYIQHRCFCFINKLLGSTVARWSELLLYSKKVLGFNPPTGWGVACRGASKLLLLFF